MNNPAHIRAAFEAMQMFSRDELAVRTQMLVEDMNEIGLDLTIRCFRFKHLLVPYYDLGNTDFGRELNGSNEVEGSGLTWGDLARLSKACKIGRTLIPQLWPARFAKRLRDSKQHLPCVAELLWLGLWRNPNNIMLEAMPFTHCKKRVDWRFSCNSQVFNLEVKYRPRDWKENIDGLAAARIAQSYFEDIGPKFPSKNQGELNLAGITTIGGIADPWRDQALLYLQQTPTLDAIIFWCLHPGPNRVTFEIIGEMKRFIQLFFTDGDDEDRACIGLVNYPMRNSAERRAMTSEEGLHALAQRFPASTRQTQEIRCT